MLNELNKNIEQKNAKIKKSYPRMNKVKVYFQVLVTDHEGNCVYESDDLTASKASKVFKTLTLTETERNKLLHLRPARYIYKLRRVQTGGYVGGIILSGSSETLETIIF